MKITASWTVSPLTFDYRHCCNTYNKQFNKSSELAKRIFSRAFECDHHLVVEILCGRWTLWMPLSSFTLSYFFCESWRKNEHERWKKLNQLIYCFPTKGRKWQNFLMGVPPATSPLTLMLQTVSCSFTHLLQEMNFLQHWIFVERTLFKFHKYELKNFRQVSKLSDNFFSGGAMAPPGPPRPRRHCT